MTANYFGTDAATMNATLAAERTRLAKLSQERWEQGRDDDSFVSQKCEEITLSDMQKAAELAADGWKVGFVGLCRLDGTPAKGRWVDSKFGGSNWMTTNAAGERVFVNGMLTLQSREGNAAAIEKLAALGFRWETRRIWANVKRYFPGKGLAGLWSSNLVVIPCDENGREVCSDALVYDARSFLLGPAWTLATGIEANEPEMIARGEAELAELNAPKVRKTRKARAA